MRAWQFPSKPIRRCNQLALRARCTSLQCECNRPIATKATPALPVEQCEGESRKYAKPGWLVAVVPSNPFVAMASSTRRIDSHRAQRERRKHCC
jgi:hypothetical protein